MQDDAPSVSTKSPSSVIPGLLLLLVFLGFVIYGLTVVPVKVYRAAVTWNTGRAWREYEKVNAAVEKFQPASADADGAISLTREYELGLTSLLKRNFIRDDLRGFLVIRQEQCKLVVEMAEAAKERYGNKPGFFGKAKGLFDYLAHVHLRLKPLDRDAVKSARRKSTVTVLRLWVQTKMAMYCSR